MDSRKRPPSTTPTKESSPTKKKKGNKSKTKKTKKNRSNSIEGTTSTTSSSNPKPLKNSMESTATADGQMMAQMLSTFSKLEQSRFEAFQRTSFPVDAVGDWVAACLSHRWNILQPQQPTTTSSTTTTTTTTTSRQRNHRPLEDLVAVGQASEIRTVVAVLAKTYAQRLVQTAARSANATTTATSSSSSSSSSTPPPSRGAALQPSDILRAYEQRRALGLDPGFFLQNARERPEFVPPETKDSFERRRLAAQEAQEEYDRQYPPPKATAEDITTKDGGPDMMDTV